MRNGTLFLLILLLAAACSPHVHLDFLGQERLEEVVLIPSPAKHKILVLDVTGVIGLSVDTGLFERESNLISRVHARLNRAAADPLVKGVILRIDSPGGEVTASDIITHEIIKFRERTGIPVVALTMGTAASGGYYIAAGCDAIFAHPSTITGSIGVISIFPNVRELFEKLGLEMTIVKSGAMKDAGSPFKEMSEEERAVFQRINDEFYEKFLDVVHSARGNFLSREKLKKLADGRILTAAQALEHGLIDSIGYIDEALAEVRSRAGIRSARVVGYTYYPKTKSNIYAAGRLEAPRFDLNRMRELLPSLKSGFYYLWLPSGF